jgi:CheY-like chemotaxis protein
VLLNLVGNAIKFTPAGEVRVVVEIESQDAAAICMHFIVADTGVGVPQDKQKMIFDPFEQADASTTRRFGGTGLGLAISAKLVRLMEGNLWLESPWHDPDSGGLVTGSAFHFTARLRPGKPPVETTPESAAPAANRRVLVVEDNEVNLKIMVRMLEKRGHTVLVARNGHEALELWRHQPVDAVLMDVQMPEMDGFEATRWIREEERTRGGHVHIVALTAHALKGDSERCLSAGMDDYLTKPIRWADLDRALASLGPAVHSTVISNP